MKWINGLKQNIKLSSKLKQKIDIINAAALSSGVEIDLNNKKAVIQSVAIDLGDSNIKHIIATDHDDKIVTSQEGNLKIVLNEGNDSVKLHGGGNMVYVNKFSGDKEIKNFYVDSCQFADDLEVIENFCVGDHRSVHDSDGDICLLYDSGAIKVDESTDTINIDAGLLQDHMVDGKCLKMSGGSGNVILLGKCLGLQ